MQFFGFRAQLGGKFIGSSAQFMEKFGPATMSLAIVDGDRITDGDVEDVAMDVARTHDPIVETGKPSLTAERFDRTIEGSLDGGCCGVE